jgi:hypothetical protein
MEVSGSFTPRPLYLKGESPRYQLYRMLGGLQSRSGCYRVEKNILSLPGIEPRPSSSLPVAIPTEVSRLPWYMSILHTYQLSFANNIGGMEGFPITTCKDKDSLCSFCPLPPLLVAPGYFLYPWSSSSQFPYITNPVFETIYSKPSLYRTKKWDRVSVIHAINIHTYIHTRTI